MFLFLSEMITHWRYNAFEGVIQGKSNKKGKFLLFSVLLRQTNYMFRKFVTCNFFALGRVKVNTFIWDVRHNAAFSVFLVNVSVTQCYIFMGFMSNFSVQWIKSPTFRESIERFFLKKNSKMGGHSWFLQFKVFTLNL